VTFLPREFADAELLLLQMARAMQGGGAGLRQFWIATGDGLARCGDQVMAEHELMNRYRRMRTFTLDLGDADLSDES